LPITPCFSFTGEWHRLVPQSWSIIPGAWHSFLEYTSFHLVETLGAYDALQPLSYFGIAFIVAPLTTATGVAMSPSITARFLWYLKIFRGHRSGNKQITRIFRWICSSGALGSLVSLSSMLSRLRRHSVTTICAGHDWKNDRRRRAEPCLAIRSRSNIILRQPSRLISG
jgi:thiosulfate reductase cytochrome b subunit